MSGPDPEATRRHWDEQASSYRHAKARNAGYYDALKLLFDRAVPAAARGRVLEVGCGTGEILASLVPSQDVGEGVGVDFSENMIAEARVRFEDASHLSFRVGDAADLGDLGEFDAVISADVFEHVPDWRAVASAMVGACRAAGIVAISTPNPRWALPLWVLEKCRLKMPEGPHDFVAAAEIADALEADGCEVDRRGTHQILPVDWAGLGVRVSTWAESAPLLRHLGVIQMVCAAKKEG